MKLLETSITDDVVKLRFEPPEDPTQSASWIEVCVPIAALKHPSNSVPLKDLNNQYLGEIRRAAIERAANILEAERQLIADQAGRLR